MKACGVLHGDKFRVVVAVGQACRQLFQLSHETFSFVYRMTLSICPMNRSCGSMLW